MAPPILEKGELRAQPILRLVWHKAFQALRFAQRAAFVGYSFPGTDFAADVLFTEALDALPQGNIKVVNLAHSESERRDIRKVYRSRFAYIPSNRFDFRAALEWAHELA